MAYAYDCLGRLCVSLYREFSVSVRKPDRSSFFLG